MSTAKKQSPVTPVIKQEKLDSPKRKDRASATSAMLNQLTEQAEEESRQQKKRRILRKLRKSTPEERRAAIEAGKVKFVNQELTESNLKKIIATNCVIIGDNNNVIGDDNVLIGKNNKASGENNKFIKSQLVFPLPEPVLPSVSSTMASAIGRQIRVGESARAQATTTALAAPVENSYYNDRELTLPEHWIIFNGTMIYKEDDILTIYKWLHDTLQCRVGDRAPRVLTWDRSLMQHLSPTFADIVGRYNVPIVYDGDEQSRLHAHATAFGTIPMPPGMPPSTRRPQPRVDQAIFTLTRSDLDPRIEPRPTQNIVSSASTTTVTTTTTTSTTTSTTSTSKNKKKSDFLPKPGVDPDESPWKVSLLDLPGSASVAGKDEPVCKICLVNRIDVMFEPCHHFAYCRDCVKEMFAHTPDKQLCPSCRKKIEYATIVFIQ